MVFGVMRKIILFTICLFGLVANIQAQQDNNGGRLSGRFQANGNFFQADSTIGAINTPQYDRQLYGADAWLNLNYSNWGFDFGLRYDFFNNSNLLNPLASYTDQGIGFWYIRKKIDKLDITGGYIYDQIGSGTIYRSFEQRPLLIDNALRGVRLIYHLDQDWTIKLLAGQQKMQFDIWPAVLKGGSIDGFVPLNEKGTVSIAPGAGVMWRTYDDETVQTLVGAVSNYTPEDSIGLQYNTYSYSVYNTLVAGPFTWFIEGAYKTNDVFNDPFAEKTNWNAPPSRGKLVNEEGHIVYTSMSYAKKGFGITLEARRQENFTFRTDPFVTLNQGMINFLPPLVRFNTFRLNTRYLPATQELGEQAIQADISYAPTRKLRFNANFSNINTLEESPLYREYHIEGSYKYKRLWQLRAGLQRQEYNQEVYEGKRGAGILKTFTPFAEFLYKMDRRKAIRFELQYMYMNENEEGDKRDYGDWLFGLVEFSVAPHWTFTVSDMYNIDPGINSAVDEEGEPMPVHFPRFDVFYTNGTNRFSLSYVKQVEGIVCTGGICRLEPAFSGVKLTVNSTF